jgi:hypothetical protein
VHGTVRQGSDRAPCLGPTYYLVAAYAVTSSVTATTVNSGFVHSIAASSRTVRRSAVGGENKPRFEGVAERLILASASSVGNEFTKPGRRGAEKPRKCHP